MIMLAVFFRLSNIIPFEEAIAQLKDYVNAMYAHEGGEVVKNNLAAIDQATQAMVEVRYDVSKWLAAEDASESVAGLPKFVVEIAKPCAELKGDSLPVSLFTPDGTMPMGTTAYEKRTIADNIPAWDPQKCIQCTQCSFVCPHAAIRPYFLDAGEMAEAPKSLTSVAAHMPALKGLNYRIQVYPQDCTGCGSCAVVCPGHALTMTPIAELLDEQKQLLEFVEARVSIKDDIVQRDTLVGSQLQQPLMQFSGACAGCGETPYVKLLTQLMGERLVIANATGCSSIWGANYPSNAYCTNRFGQGPAWGNSLFEDNAEYGFGIAVAMAHRREQLADSVKQLADSATTPGELTKALNAWLDSRYDSKASKDASKAALDALQANSSLSGVAEILADADLFVKKSVWAIGGDGWAYDIGFAGLDHVLAQNVDINILVMDTECYSNTGGQTSKATPVGAVAKYSADGKRTYKKDLGRMMMTYPDVYVASIAMGSNFMQAIKAMTEADAYPGPAIVIAYCPCINHGIRAGMSHAMTEEREAVRCGYWQLYRYNPTLSPSLTVDSPAPEKGTLIPFINGEDRYADLKMVDSAAASALQPRLEDRCDAIYDLLLYNSKYVTK